MRDQATNAYIYGLMLFAAAAFGVWFYAFEVPFGVSAVVVASILALTCGVSRRFKLEQGRDIVEISDVAVLSALVLLGPIWAILVAAPTFLYRERLRTVFVASGDIIKILAAGYVFQFFSEPLLFDPQFGPLVVYGIMAGGAVSYALDAAINAVLLRLKYNAPPLEVLKEDFLPLVPSDIAAVLAALGTAYMMVAFGPAATLVLFAGAAAALISLHLIHKYQRESMESKEENAALLASHVAFAAGIVEAVGTKDGFTARLAAASSVYAGDVGKEFGLSEPVTEKLKVAALLQDVGMVGVPDEVFMSPPGKLNSVGRMSFERHAVEGEKILSGAPGFEEAAKWVRWHHERVDGTGYPDRLKGQWIPIEARILAVCESYSAMILAAPHSPALAPHEARIKLTSLSGVSLDAEVVKALLRVLDREDENYATAADDRFAFAAPSADTNGSRSLRIV